MIQVLSATLEEWWPTSGGVSFGKNVNSKNLTLVLILTLINALLLALMRVTPVEPDAKIIAYILVGCITLFIVWLLYSDHR